MKTAEELAMEAACDVFRAALRAELIFEIARRPVTDDDLAEAIQISFACTGEEEFQECCDRATDAALEMYDWILEQERSKKPPPG